MEEWIGGPVYAPNLIGCGLEDGNDKWDPDQRGMSIPLDWARAIEQLIQEQVLASSNIQNSGESRSNQGGTIGQFLTLKDTLAQTAKSTPSCVVVAQGGSAPIGVLLASRNPTSVISKLILTSPPTWNDITAAVPQDEIEKNYNFYRSSWGKATFLALENRFAVRLFSDLFLFLEKCDDRWIELTCSKEATTLEARPPVMVFNSGFLQARSFEEELRELDQPALVMSGIGDKRAEKRVQFGSEMKSCILASANGTNVLPWEVPGEICQAIQSFI